MKLSSPANYRWRFMGIFFFNLELRQQTILMKYHALLVVFEKAANVKLSSAANYRWRFMGIFYQNKKIKNKNRKKWVFFLI